MPGAALGVLPVPGVDCVVSPTTGGACVVVDFFVVVSASGSALDFVFEVVECGPTRSESSPCVHVRRRQGTADCDQAGEAWCEKSGRTPRNAGNRFGNI